MFLRLRQQFSASALALSLIAIVLALTGGALAATNATSSKAKSKSKAVKGPRGPRGPKGPKGPKGERGEKGDTGAAGQNGSNGTDGANGKSVSVGSAGAGECGEGGITIEVEGSGTKHEVCNGEAGEDGEPGEPGAIHPGETLPPEATETGAWAFGPRGAGEEKLAISFTIPLAAALDGSHVHFLNAAGKEVVLNESTFVPEEITSTACLGNVGAPTAKKGNLCIYTGLEEKLLAFSNFSIKPLDFVGQGTSTAGALFTIEAEGSGADGVGSWAVTADS